MNADEAYERFIYGAKPPRRPEFPLLTEMLYVVCGNDAERFHLVEESLHAAFDAGFRAAKDTAE